MADDFGSQTDPALVAGTEADASVRRAWIEPPPREVLDGARRRDPAALEAFFDVYFEPVFSFAWRLVGNRAKAEDLAQEVFLKIHRSIDRLEAERDPWPWIATIVHNACKDVWRSSAHRMDRSSQSIDADPTRPDRLASRTEGPEATLIASERQQLVRAAIDRLPEADRQLVLLYDYEGLSHIEAAQILGIGYAAVRKRYSRALEALGRMLRETMG